MIMRRHHRVAVISYSTRHFTLVVGRRAHIFLDRAIRTVISDNYGPKALEGSIAGPAKLPRTAL